MIKKPRTLQKYLVLSWLFPVAVSMSAAAIVFFLLGWLDYKNANERIADELNAKSAMAARRLSAELLLKSAGAVDSVASLLKSELGLNNLEVRSSLLPCDPFPAGDGCYAVDRGFLHLARRVPYIEENQYVVVSHPINTYFKYLNSSFFFWGAFPVFATILAGLALQRHLMRKHVLTPIRELKSVAERQREIPSTWPKELQEIGNELASSFRDREQAVFVMLAKGVIHDIKTLTHSILTGVVLAKEKKDDPKAEVLRLKGLLNACEKNIPKMKRIIEQTLDGSREISVRPVASDLVATLKESIETNQSLADQYKVNLKTDIPQSLVLAHDPLQLERAFSNLVKNGIEAAVAGDKTHRMVEVQIEDSKTQTKIIVEDTGSGIEDKNVFEPMRSSKAHGAGLGLYVTKKIIRAHRGEIEAQSNGQYGGARFTVTLPKRENHEVTI